MNNELAALKTENEKLKNRLARLAREKSHFQIISHVLVTIEEQTGLENLVRNAINTIMDSMGGSNVIFYYLFAEKWYKSDISSGPALIDPINDPDILETIATQNFVESRVNEEEEKKEAILHFSEEKFLPAELGHWSFPLISENEVIGILKLENIFLQYSKDIKTDLGLIIKYLSLNLKNEINRTDKLRKAYSALKKERRSLEEQIIEREKTEEELQKKNDYLNSLFRATDNIGIIVTDLNGEKSRILEVNPGGEKLLNASSQEIIGKPVNQFFSPESASPIRIMQADLITCNERPSENIILLPLKGKSKPAILNIYPQKNKSGKTNGMICIILDISEKQEQDRRYKQTIESSFDGFWIIDMKGRFVEVNQSYADLIGYTREELLNMSVSDVEARELSKDIEKHIAENVDSRVVRFETKHQTRSGKILDVEVNSTYSPDSGGCFYVFLKDISESNKMKREKDELQQQYYQAQKMESVGRLAGGVAHDLNNLLSPILGYSELLMNELSQYDSRRHRIEQIFLAGSKARDMVHQLLLFSRKHSMEYKTVNLNELISGFEKLLRRTIRENIQISIELVNQLSFITADIGQIEQVIMNLCVNAQYAMPAGGNLVLKTSLSDDNQHIILQIRDTGCGMDNDTLKHIFEPFFTTKGEEGTGLGLSTVFGIIEQHKGSIKVESQQNEGTSFIIQFPVSLPLEETAKEEKKQSPFIDQKLNILLIEDNGAVREMTELLLTNSGFCVQSVSDGETAHELFKQNKQDYDLVISDVILPGKSGPETFKLMKEEKPDLKVLFMSGYPANKLDILKKEQQMPPFIQKPFALDQLLAKIAELV